MRGWRRDGRRDASPPSGDPSALDVVSHLMAAMAVRDTDTMESLHAEDYVVDWVYGDAFEDPPVSAERSAAFWSAWFTGFEDVDLSLIHI